VAIFRRTERGFFLDVGANEPQKGSQTWMLEKRGWRGILIEPQARLCERLRQARPESRIFQTACGAQAEMPLYTAATPGHSGLVKNLVDATTNYGNPAIDFVAMDVEGTQFDVLRGFDLQRHAQSCCG
jgi:FkbM family methyltransferase